MSSALRTIVRSNAASFPRRWQSIPIHTPLRLNQRRFQSAIAAINLTNANLSSIEQSARQKKTQLELPKFDRSNLKEGIVHIGVGGFHRAHLAVFVDSLMGEHGAKDWAICGIGLRDADAGMGDVLAAQDYMYTILERSRAGSNARVIGSINSFLFAPNDPSKVIDKMAHEDTKIVSMTITEGGYYYNENTHQLQIEDPDIVADLASTLEAPRTTLGYLFAALEKRHAAGLEPFTVLSCDNMLGNGHITKSMLTSFARARSPKIADWIEKKGRFPNSMVDRITPRTTDNDKTALANDFGVQDQWPVVTEPFTQWVVEDSFVNGRPDFEKVGVQVVSTVQEVERFERHKLRLLNASHSALAYGAFLGGFQYVHEVFEDPTWHKFISNMMHKEVKPLLPSIPGVDLDKYCQTLLDRFANPAIMDQVNRLTLNGSGKLPQFIIPTIAEHIMAGTHDFKRLVFVVASWFRYLNGVDEQGRRITIDDPMAADLQKLAIEGGDKPFPLLNVQSLFGDDLRNDKVFMEEITTALKLLHRDGVKATLEKYVD